MEVYYVNEHEEGYDIVDGSVTNRVNEYRNLIGVTGIYGETSGLYIRKEDAIEHAKRRARLLFNPDICPFQSLEDCDMFLDHQGMVTIEHETPGGCRFYTLIVHKASVMEKSPWE